MSRTTELLEALVEYNSSNQAAANDAIDFCKQWLESAGLEVEEIINEGYKMLVCTVGKGARKVILNGHVDVVDGHENQFKPQVIHDKMYGRGTADMKGGLCAMMVALSELREVDLGDTAAQLHIVSDEETGGQYGSSYLADQGYLGDFVICGEPTQLGVGLKAKGVLQLDVLIHGKAAHGSRPWEGDNAILKAVKTYKEIEKLPFASMSCEWYDTPSINLAKIAGGNAYNTVPETCTLNIDIRYLPGQSSEAIINEIKEVTDGEIKVHYEAVPVDNDLNDEHIQQLLTSIKHITGKSSPRVFGQHGTSDAAYYLKQGVPAVEFGPIGANWHGEGEYVNVKSVETYKDILKDFVQRFS